MPVVVVDLGLVVLLTVALTVVAGQVVLPPAVENGSCQVPSSSDVGQCVPLREYPRYVELLRNVQRSEQETAFLRSSVCGRSPDSGGVLVCRPVRLNDPECGRGIRDRIVKGKIAELDDYPWMALFQYRKPKGDTGFHCGGVLITRRYVLSAAHCFVGLRTGWEAIMVRLGEWDFESELDCTQGEGEELHCAPPVQDFSLERIIPHEEFTVKDLNRANDVALVRMSGDAVFSNYVKPICLPEGGAVDSDRLYEGILVASGWGKTENASASRYKLYTELSVSDYDSCREEYVRNLKIQLGEGQLCAGGDDGRDTCNGDSGGPLMKEVAEQGRFYVTGLVSFGPNRCGEQLPGVYTRVEHYLRWIVTKVVESSSVE